MTTFGDKFKALFYGPGWQPGTPRLGDLTGMPDKTPQRPKYNPTLPKMTEAYLVAHFFATLFIYQELAAKIDVSYL